MQHVNSGRTFSKGQDVSDARIKAPPKIPDNLLSRVNDALKKQDQKSPVWFQLVDFAYVMGFWLEAVRDYFRDKKIEALFNDAIRAIYLGENVPAIARVWLEYGAIIDFEHLEAQRRREPIRHIHGIEATTIPKEMETRQKEEVETEPKEEVKTEQKEEVKTEQKETVEPEFVKKRVELIENLAQKNLQANPKDLPALQEIMLKNAVEITLPLIPQLEEYLKLVEKLIEKSREEVKQ